MSVQSKLLETAIDPYKRRRAVIIAVGSVAAIALAHWATVSRNVQKTPRPTIGKVISLAPGDETTKKKAKPAFDPLFLRQLKELLRIMVPGVFSKEAGIIGIHSIILICRTFLTIYVAQLEGSMVQAIVEKVWRKTGLKKFYYGFYVTPM
uniref:ABC transmembrane type-1 domain-containing protein n=1 Tax=Caenorhabditis japonica TaxID=281687 RepID=A0A8R1IF38_CAEJA